MERFILKVPIGTQIYEDDNNTLIYDFKKNKEKYLVAWRKRWLGNVDCKVLLTERQEKTDGKNGEEFWIWLQLKIVADVGIIGCLTLANQVCCTNRAKPKILVIHLQLLIKFRVAYYNNKE